MVVLPLFGEDSHFDLYFSLGLKPSTIVPAWKSVVFGVTFSMFRFHSHFLRGTVDGKDLAPVDFSHLGIGRHGKRRSGKL